MAKHHNPLEECPTSRMEEGDACPECDATVTWAEVDNCSCHVSAPCQACVACSCVCEGCGWEEEIYDGK